MGLDFNTLSLLTTFNFLSFFLSLFFFLIPTFRVVCMEFSLSCSLNLTCFHSLASPTMSDVNEDRFMQTPPQSPVQCSSPHESSSPEGFGGAPQESSWSSAWTSPEIFSPLPARSSEPPIPDLHITALRTTNHLRAAESKPRLDGHWDTPIPRREVPILSSAS
ncbi:hypothetical protein CPB84DRAFT_607225 [Gymnopilus junonius]|uniref:Uncharacterized protein n=1 Tax=Gymnopilus junonius TaxID=109634 RepID=A0A9P5N843_GYMJU|nr:hypothetical protein CPB84DRAFT_607225 [Gymnopilus junonius]